MVIKTTTNNEFHKNGQLAYTETICVLAPSSAGLYNRRLQHPSGYEWIRIGRQAKYFDNGQIAWELFYDNNGDVIRDKTKHYRKDGSHIVYL